MHISQQGAVLVITIFQHCPTDDARYGHITSTKCGACPALGACYVAIASDSCGGQRENGSRDNGNTRCLLSPDAWMCLCDSLKMSHVARLI